MQVTREWCSGSRACIAPAGTLANGFAGEREVSELQAFTLAYRLWQQRAAPPVGGRVHWALREEVTCPTIDSTVDASFD